MKALAHASSLPSSEVKVVSMGAAVYKLSTGLILPPNTTLTGVGSKSILEFSIQPPKPAGGNCSAPVTGLDFFKENCQESKEHCFHDVKEYDNTTSSLQVRRPLLETESILCGGGRSIDTLFCFALRRTAAISVFQIRSATRTPTSMIPDAAFFASLKAARAHVAGSTIVPQALVAPTILVPLCTVPIRQDRW